MGNPADHNRLSPSSSHRWMNCHGSIRLIESLPPEEQNRTSFYANEGTKAHSLAASMLKGEVTIPDTNSEYDVNQYVDAVNFRMKALGESMLVVEKKVTLDRIKPTPPVPMGGTPDVVLVSPEWLEIWDLKYGQGVLVEAENNTQMLTYLLGAILTYGARPHYAINIVQPRAMHPDGPIRRWEPTGIEIQQFRYEMLRAAHATMKPDAPLKAGSWCQFCPARGHCPELSAHAQLIAQTEFDVPAPILPNPEHLPLEVAADMLTKVPVLEMWVKALRDRILNELQAGHPVPGWKLVNKRAMRVWQNEEKVYEWAKTAGVPKAKITETKLSSPAQIEKIVGKKALPKELYVSVSSGVTLAPEADKRPAVTGGEEFKMLPPATDPIDSTE